MPRFAGGFSQRKILKAEPSGILAQFFLLCGKLRGEFFPEQLFRTQTVSVSSGEDVTAARYVQREKSSPVPQACFLQRHPYDAEAHGIALCSYCASSFILIVCPKTVDRIRGTYFSCPSVHSNLTGAGDPRSTAFSRA